MAESIEKAEQWLAKLKAQLGDQALDTLFHPDNETPYHPLPVRMNQTPAGVEKLLETAGADAHSRANLYDQHTRDHTESYLSNIENFIGSVKLPVGIAGPLRICGMNAKGDYTLPLATHEAALVASYHRGSLAISESGGCHTAIVSEGISRVPCFTFCTMNEAAQFLAWAVPRQQEFEKVAESTTRHGKLNNMKVTVEGSNVFLHFEYTTGDAAGQNMVTVATQAVVDHIRQHTPIQPKRAYIESNLSGDKKASAISFSNVRGRKVTCEVLVPGEVLKKRLGICNHAMEDYWRVSSIGGVLSGTLGIQGHYANGLAALFIACGQDAACVAEAAVGVTRFEKYGEALYASVTLPNLVVGTVGGGTALPSQTACLSLLGLAGEGHAHALAEVCAAVCLAGELSIIAALASGSFTRAHELLARRRKKKTTQKG